MRNNTIIRRLLLTVLVLTLLLTGSHAGLSGLHPGLPGFTDIFSGSGSGEILPSLPVQAAVEGLTLKSQDGTARSYSTDSSDYAAYINDEEDLLTDDEEASLLEKMAPITEYGNAAFMTSRLSRSDYVAATGSIYHELFGSTSGTIFMIDMNHRQLIIFSDGAVYDTITKSYADTITDNIYKMAKRGDYYDCAEEAFSEIYTLLSGARIAQPMRHITNAMLSVILSALILYFVARRSARQRSAQADEVLSVLGASALFTGGRLDFSSQKKVYNPHTSDDSRGGGGGGGGGGGSSGGGGSHGF